MPHTIIVSDLHLGARNSQTETLRWLLDQDFDRLIVNGDLMDHWNLDRFSRDHWNILNQLRVLADNSQLTVVLGNHDIPHCPGYYTANTLSWFLDCCTLANYTAEFGGKKYMIIHGDAFDHTLRWRRARAIGDLVYSAAQRVSRRLAAWLKHRAKHTFGVDTSVRDGAVAFAKSLGCQGVICGHTHEPAYAWVDGVHYWNTGSWTEHPCHYVAVDTNGKVTMRQLPEAE